MRGGDGVRVWGGGAGEGRKRKRMEDKLSTRLTTPCRHQVSPIHSRAMLSTEKKAAFMGEHTHQLKHMSTHFCILPIIWHSPRSRRPTNYPRARARSSYEQYANQEREHFYPHAGPTFQRRDSCHPRIHRSQSRQTTPLFQRPPIISFHPSPLSPPRNQFPCCVHGRCGPPSHPSSQVDFLAPPFTLCLRRRPSECWRTT